MTVLNPGRTSAAVGPAVGSSAFALRRLDLSRLARTGAPLAVLGATGLALVTAGAAAVSLRRRSA